MLELVCRACQTAGLFTQCEASVPQFANWIWDPRQARWSCAEGLLDVVAQNLATGDDFCLDVTVKNPAAQKYLRGDRNASDETGFACAVSLEAAVDYC